MCSAEVEGDDKGVIGDAAQMGDATISLDKAELSPRSESKQSESTSSDEVITVMLHLCKGLGTCRPVRCRHKSCSCLHRKRVVLLMQTLNPKLKLMQDS